jgi:hypothetical protein
MSELKTYGKSLKLSFSIFSSQFQHVLIRIIFVDENLTKKSAMHEMIFNFKGLDINGYKPHNTVNNLLFQPTIYIHIQGYTKQMDVHKALMIQNYSHVPVAYLAISALSLIIENVLPYIIQKLFYYTIKGTALQN